MGAYPGGWARLLPLILTHDYRPYTCAVVWVLAHYRSGIRSNDDQTNLIRVEALKPASLRWALKETGRASGATGYLLLERLAGFRFG